MTDHAPNKVYGLGPVRVVCTCGDEFEGDDLDDALDRHDADLASASAHPGAARARQALAAATARKSEAR